MKVTAPKRHRLQTLALALLLVCAQAFMVSHDALHGVGEAHDICGVCSIGGTLKHAAVAAETLPPDPPAPAPFDPLSLAQTAVLHVQGPEARAPPRHS